MDTYEVRIMTEDGIEVLTVPDISGDAEWDVFNEHTRNAEPGEIVQLIHGEDVIAEFVA